VVLLQLTNAGSDCAVCGCDLFVTLILVAIIELNELNGGATLLLAIMTISVT
jgi:hypothetical protein